jgi:hypothetical protein
MTMAPVSKALKALTPKDYTTWLVLGAAIQYLLVTSLPRNVALLPPAALLVFSMLRSYFITTVSKPKWVSSDVTLGRQTWQIPVADGTQATKGSSESIVVLVLAASWNHPNGQASPGSQQIGEYFRAMWVNAEAKREEYGFLGNTPAMMTRDIGLREDAQGVNVVYLSYWKTLDGLHKFAHGDVHMKGQMWWERVAMKEHKHIGVMHETYEVPAGNWENVFHNFRKFGICKCSS